MQFSRTEEAKEYLHDTYDNIETEDIYTDGEYCYIFFSSNGICSDEPVERFVETLEAKNRYEWKSIANAIRKDKHTGRFIFVRDVHKKHYMYGVSRENNSIEKTVEELKRRTSDRNWKIVTIGISSGGYMSVIAGTALQAYKIFDIAGQHDLTDAIQERYRGFETVNPGYGSLLGLIAEYDKATFEDKADIWYLCSYGNEGDHKQHDMIKDYDCVKPFLFPDEKHAATVYPFNFPDLIMISRKKMDRLYSLYAGRMIDKKVFLLRTMTISGWMEFIKRALNSGLNAGKLRSSWDVK